jgi:hypothetical protein
MNLSSQLHLQSRFRTCDLRVTTRLRGGTVTHIGKTSCFAFEIRVLSMYKHLVKELVRFFKHNGYVLYAPPTLTLKKSGFCSQSIFTCFVKYTKQTQIVFLNVVEMQ